MPEAFLFFSFSLSFVLLYYFILLYFANTLSDVTLQKSAIHRQGLSTQSVANESTITALSEKVQLSLFPPPGLISCSGLAPMQE